MSSATRVSCLDSLLKLTTAMKKMANSNVLIVGMKGLGVEIGKWRNDAHN